MKKPSRSLRGMSLVEVTIAIGILTFCAVAIMGLLPTMLTTAREAREATVVSRIHQAVATDLRENPPTGQRTWHFSSEGLRLPNSASSQDHDYLARSSAPSIAALAGSSNPNIQVVTLIIENPHRGSTNLIRPIFINDGFPTSP